MANRPNSTIAVTPTGKWTKLFVLLTTDTW